VALQQQARRFLEIALVVNRRDPGSHGVGGRRIAERSPGSTDRRGHGRRAPGGRVCTRRRRGPGSRSDGAPATSRTGTRRSRGALAHVGSSGRERCGGCRRGCREKVTAGFARRAARLATDRPASDRRERPEHGHPPAPATARVEHRTSSRSGSPEPPPLEKQPSEVHAVVGREPSRPVVAGPATAAIGAGVGAVAVVSPRPLTTSRAGGRGRRGRHR
jgi:hypothetical protein